MKVEKSPLLLSNIEILEHLKSTRAHSRCENSQTISVELQAYLRERPAGNQENPQSVESVKTFLAALKENSLDLTRAESLQIVNSAPASLPVLYCLIEEADMRFTPEQLDLLLELTAQHLGGEPAS